jgi:hypothetical protein
MQLEGESIALAGDQWRATLPAKIASVEDYPHQPADVRWLVVLLWPGPIIFGGMQYVNSGYRLWDALPGSALLALSVTDD